MVYLIQAIEIFPNIATLEFPQDGFSKNVRPQMSANMVGKILTPNIFLFIYNQDSRKPGLTVWFYIGAASILESSGG